jgi:enoyl-CoA hydratase/carnithine racemase
MTAYPTLLCEARGPVTVLTLNRPEKKNPIGPQVCGELVHALATIKSDVEVRVVILTGAGGVFSAGGDLSMMSSGMSSSGHAGIPPASLVDLFTAMHVLGKPIIAMVPGPALAGGLGLMVACDMVIAAETATFGTTEIAVGLWPMMITAEITRNVGRKKTLEMMLTGRKLTAGEALACGLINQAVPADELEAVTMKLAESIAARSPAAMALGLNAFYTSQDMEYIQQLPYLQQQLGTVLALEDAAEGISAFFAKRQPKWKGK